MSSYASHPGSIPTRYLHRNASASCTSTPTLYLARIHLFLQPRLRLHLRNTHTHNPRNGDGHAKQPEHAERGLTGNGYTLGSALVLSHWAASYPSTPSKTSVCSMCGEFLPGAPVLCLPEKEILDLEHWTPFTPQYDQVSGILGGGQLGRTLAASASLLNIKIAVLDSGESAPTKQAVTPVQSPGHPYRWIKQLAAGVHADVLTVEIKHVDINAYKDSPQTVVDMHDPRQREGYVQLCIAGAGGAAQLPCMAAVLTPLLVIGVPVGKLHGIPVATVAINNGMNAGLSAIRTLSTGDFKLTEAMSKYRSDLEKEVMGKAGKIDKLDQVGWEAYEVKRS
ncbi:phosphoribosylaminoimidazole carboxylase ade2 [Paramarasmius palmivorus]|uniref:phosphoribosylaminoimidazole carboxylase n=1 Tax=Paramarasmius palmivorus TaxID=297713 RepID=A0AAW0BQI5_9AGAR